jgi:hypothetical protein
MPFGASRLAYLAKPAEVAAAGRDTSFITYGNVQIDTAQSYFGGSSVYFDGDNDMLEATLDSTLSNSTYNGSWTIEMWVRPDGTSTNTAAAFFVTNRQGGYGARIYQMLHNMSTNEARFSWKGWNGSDPIEEFNFYSGSNTIPDDTWTHIAFGFDAPSKTGSLWVDGTRTNTDTFTYSNNEVNLSSAAGLLQGSFGGGVNNEYEGWIDETRLSLVDRYGVSNSSITVPTIRFFNDDDTMYLNHFEGTDGSTTFEDDDDTTAFYGTGGDSVQDVDISGTTYRIHEFTSGGSFTAQRDGTVDVLLVGGGGPGGDYTSGTRRSNDRYGGGGGAQTQYQSGVSVSENTGYTITVSSTTAPGSNNGGSTTGFGYTSTGGGSGGNYAGSNSGATNGKTGGSAGGGGGTWSDYYFLDGNGGSGTYAGAGAGNTIGGGGGGNGSAASSSSGGSGVSYSTYFGTGYGNSGTFGAGGDAQSGGVSAPSANSGDGGDGAGGFSNSASGAAGTVLIRYQI